MSFVDGFFTFSLSITNSDAQLYESLRIKTAKHPDETLEHLTARTIALAHSYAPGIEFSQGLYKPDQPAVLVPDGIGGIKKWIDVGCPPLKKVKRALDEFSDACHAVYFYQPEHLSAFCQSMRGTRKNWIAPVSFYSFDNSMLQSISDTIDFRNQWRCTFIDGNLYFESDSIECHGPITSHDIWYCYQQSIGNE